MPFYVTIKDYEGKDVIIEVSQQIYQLFDDERKAKERERYEHRKHLDDRDWENYSIAEQLVTKTTEDIFLNREKLSEVYTIVKTCTLIQQERFYLYRICGYTYAEIAQLHNCGKPRVKKSISVVIEKIEKYFSK